MAAPVVLPVAATLIRVGVSLLGMTNGSVLEAGTRMPPTMATADTMYVAPGTSPVMLQLMVAHGLLMQAPPAGGAGHSWAS